MSGPLAHLRSVYEMSERRACRWNAHLDHGDDGTNRKRIQRIYREEKLTVRRRGGCKRAMGTRRPLEVPLVANRRRFRVEAASAWATAVA